MTKPILSSRSISTEGRWHLLEVSLFPDMLTVNRKHLFGEEVRRIPVRDIADVAIHTTPWKGRMRQQLLLLLQNGKTIRLFVKGPGIWMLEMRNLLDRVDRGERQIQVAAVPHA